MLALLLELSLFESLDFDDDSVFDSDFEPDPESDPDPELESDSVFVLELSESVEELFEARLSVT